MNAYRNRSPPRTYGRDPRASTGTVYASPFDSRSSRYDRGYDIQPVTRRVVDDGSRGTTHRTEYSVRPRHGSFVAEENRRPPSTLMLPPSSPNRNRPVVMEAPRERDRSPVSRSQNRDGSDRHLHPASSGSYATSRNHQRHYSATPADTDRLVVAGRDGRERARYHQPSQAPKTYPASRPPIRYSEEDGYSYTGPREQFARDYPMAPPPPRDPPSRRDRPLSIVELPPDYKPSSTTRKDMGPPPASARQLDRLDRPDPSRLSARAPGESDSARSSDFPQRRHSMRNPVVHQSRNAPHPPSYDDKDSKRSSKQYRSRYGEDDEYSKQWDLGKPNDPDKDYGRGPQEYRRKPRSRDPSPDYVSGPKTHLSRGDDHRRPPRSRESSPDRPSRPTGSVSGPDNRRVPRSRDPSPERSTLAKGLAAVGLGGIAGAGLANGYVKEPRDKDDEQNGEEKKERRRRRHRDRESDKDRIRDVEDDMDPRDSRAPPENGAEPLGGRREYADKMEVSSDSQEGHHRSRKHRRRRHRPKDSGAADSHSESESDRLPAHDPADLPREVIRFNPGEVETRRAKEDAHRRAEDIVPALEGRTLSPGENADDRPRRVQLVEPVREDRPDLRPRGILKPPRAVPFPEDPNPIREGVAPLNAAIKDGVPPNARWTKISRVLVNPEALEKANERFEERDDYVIVLRVISKEEIAKLAEKTREIRETREREWQEELEEKKQQRMKPDHSRNDEPDQLEERMPSPLHIEPASYAEKPSAYAPQPAANDAPVYAAAPDPLGRSMPEQQIAPIVNIIPDTYSEHV